MKQMKRIIYIAAIAVATLSSCQKENTSSSPVSDTIEIALKGSVQNNDTKATYTKDASAYNFAWEADDAFSLTVADGTNNNVKFTNKDGQAGNNKTFTGTVTSWEGQKNVYAVYPYNAQPTDVAQWVNFDIQNGETYANAKLNVSVNFQNIKAGNNRAQTSLLIASAQNVASPSALESLSFKQVMSILNFNISNIPAGYTVTNVSLHCDEAVFPVKAEFSFSNPETAPTILKYAKDINSIVTEATAGTSTQLYFSIIPTDLMNGKNIYIQIILKGSTDIKMLNLQKSGIAFARNTIYTVNADCTSAISTGQTGTVSYGGVTYNTVCMKDGKWWFSQNLRYLPSNYPTPSSDVTNVTAGVYYPVFLNAKKDGVEFSTADTAIASNGYLYQSEVALGLKVGDITSVEQAKALEGTQGICPDGWHIPTAIEILNLVGKAVSPFKTNLDAPYYDASSQNATIAKLNADGFNAAAWGCVSIQDNTKTKATLMGYLTKYPGIISSGYICGSTYTSCTTDNKTGAIKNFMFLGFMPMANNGTFNGSKLSYRIGASVRCVRRATSEDFE